MGTLEDWTDAVRLRLDLNADLAADLDEALVLDLAREAAHGVARPAAPITTFLLGVAVARGADPRATTEKIIELARGWERPEPEPDRHRDVTHGE